MLDAERENIEDATARTELSDAVDSCYAFEAAVYQVRAKCVEIAFFPDLQFQRAQFEGVGRDQRHQ